MKERAVFLFFFLFTLRFLFFYLIEYTVKILNNVYRTNLFSAVFSVRYNGNRTRYHTSFGLSTEICRNPFFS